MAPLYDYVCDECENVQEELHPMSGPDYNLKCEKCGSTKLKKAFSRPGMFLFAHKVPKPIDPRAELED